MNYRHAFHAGNFADVFKHIILVRILTHLREKTAPFGSSTPTQGRACTILPAKRRVAPANGAMASAGLLG
jgi:23S rRNA A2030 N6-methylase RlmJ